MSLQRALEALPENPSLALEELLLSWKATPDSRVASLIEALGDRFTAARPEVHEDDWYDVEKKKDPADLGRLLATLLSADEVFGMQELCKRPSDPRLSTWSLAVIERRLPWPPDWVGYGHLQILKRSADARAAARLARVVAAWPAQAERPQAWIASGSPEASFVANQANHEELAGQIAQLAAKLKKAQKALPEEEAALIEEVRAAIAKAGNLDGGAPAKARKATAPKATLSSDGVESMLERAANARDPEARLTALLAAWSAHRSPELASLVESAGAAIAREPLPLKPESEAVSAWRDCEKERAAADLDRLIAALPSGKVPEIIHRLERLAGWPPDPRLTRLAARMLAEQPFRSRGARPIYPAITALLGGMNDPRAPGMVAHLQTNCMPGLGLEGGADFQSFFRSLLQRAAKAAAALPPAPPTSPALAAQIAALSGKLAAANSTKEGEAEQEQELLALIWASPDDDAPRLVYADFLSQRGKPLGEFIALQLSKADPKREKALLKAHAREFLGPLAPAMNVTGVCFERGFVRHAVLSDKLSPLIAALETHPAWSTLKSVFAFTGRRSYPRMMKHLDALGVKVCVSLTAYQKSLPK